MSLWKNIWKKMPRSKIFRYNKNIDRQVVSAVSSVLNVNAKKAVKMKHGEVNHVYKLIAEKEFFLVRVFKNKDWPETGKLLWIDKQLMVHSIPHAKILYYSRSNKFFPFGFMITQFIGGYNGEQAVEKRQLSLAKTYYNIGKILKKVHAIKIKKFGVVNNGSGNYSNFLKWKLDRDVRRRFTELRATKKFTKEIAIKTEKKVRECLSPFAPKFKPVLNHGDPNRGNCIWSTDKRWILIDWDNAISSTWIEDYTDLTFWADFRKNKSFTTNRLRIFKKNFFLGYGKVEFSRDQLGQIEHGLHIIKCMKLLPYYYFGKKDMGDFYETERKLLKLIEADF